VNKRDRGEDIAIIVVYSICAMFFGSARTNQIAFVLLVPFLTPKLVDFEMQKAINFTSDVEYKNHQAAINDNTPDALLFMHQYYMK